MSFVIDAVKRSTFGSFAKFRKELLKRWEQELNAPVRRNQHRLDIAD